MTNVDGRCLAPLVFFFVRPVDVVVSYIGMYDHNFLMAGVISLNHSAMLEEGK